MIAIQHRAGFAPNGETEDPIARVSAWLHDDNLAYLRQFAAGVGHRLNNPASFVSSNLATLKEYMGIFKRLLTEYEALVTGLQTAPSTNQQERLRRIEALLTEEDLPYILADADHLLDESRDGMRCIAEIIHDRVCDWR